MEGFIISWVFRWTETLATGSYEGRLIGLGAYRDVGIQEAREKALIYRRMLEEGKDPRLERANALCDEQSAKDHFRTLAQVTAEYVENKMLPKSKANPRGYTRGYVARIEQCLRDYVLEKVHPTLGVLGSLPIQKIDFHMLFNKPSEHHWGCDLETLWVAKHPTTRDMLLHLRGVFAYAKAHSYYIGDNPVDRDLIKAALPAPKTFYEKKQHKGVPYREAPAFIQRLRNFRYDRPWHIVGPDGRPIPAYLLEWIVLTGARVAEARKARWKEIDFATMTWNVPVENLKTKNRKGKLREKGLPRPITSKMLRILKDMQTMRKDPADHDAFIFLSPIFKPGRKSAAIIGQQTLIRLLRRNLGVELKDKKDQAEILRQCAEIDARADLTRNDQIRAKYAAGMTRTALAEEYGVTKSRIGQVVGPLPKEIHDRKLANEEEELVNHAFRTTLLDWCRSEEFPDVLWRAQVDHELGETQADNRYGDDTLLLKRRWNAICPLLMASLPRNRKSNCRVRQFRQSRRTKQIVKCFRTTKQIINRFPATEARPGKKAPLRRHWLTTTVEAARSPPGAAFPYHPEPTAHTRFMSS